MNCIIDFPLIDIISQRKVEGELSYGKCWIVKSAAFHLVRTRIFIQHDHSTVRKNNYITCS